MKKWKIVALTGMTAFSLAACSVGNSNNGTDSVIVKTKSDTITQEEFYKELKAKYGSEVLSTMIQDSILLDKYKITDKDIQERIKYYKNATGISKDEDFETYVKSAGFASMADFKEQLKTNLAQMKAVTAGVTIKEADIKKEYENKKSQISASHILITDEATANEVYDKIKKGAKFEDMVAQYSEDTASQTNGGSLGFFSKGTMDTNFEAVAFELKKGEISKPVKSTYGYHIIRLDDKKTVSYKELKPTIEEELKLEKAKSFPTVYDKLKKEYKLDIKDKKLKKEIEEAATKSTTSTDAATTTTAN